MLAFADTALYYSIITKHLWVLIEGTKISIILSGVIIFSHACNGESRETIQCAKRWKGRS